MSFSHRLSFGTVVLAIGLLVVPPEARFETKVQNPPAPALPRPGGPLGELDELFLNSYRARREVVKQETSPVIVVSGSDLILFRAGTEKGEREKVIPDIYHALKAVAHLPFAIYLRLLAPASNGIELPQYLLKELELFEKRINAAHGALSGWGFTQEQIERQTKILTESKAIVSDVLRDKRISMSRLSTYAKRLGPFMLANASDAGCSQIRGTHFQVMKWKQSLVDAYPSN